MIYYVDSRYGCDENDGLSRQTAWRTLEKVNAQVFKGGDSLLFKAGETYEGHLCPKRERDGGIVCIGRYGTGDKPEIVAPDGIAVQLCNFDGVELSDLSITNPNGIRGIFIHNTVGGELKHIHVKNCRIHDINTARSSFSYESGGIICVSFCDEPGWFNDLLLEDNEITDVTRSGILLSGLWANRPTKLWGRNEYVSDTENWWPSYNVVVRGNYIDRTGGDGIVLIGTVDALIEWNTVYHVMTTPRPPCANAGIWPQSSNGCVVQYNEVGHCQKPEGCNDAQGFDVDLSCRDTLIQYNYSHDNGGGFLLLCETAKTREEDNFRGTIVRNNLSVGDGNVKGELIALVSPVRGALIENNTFYATGNAERLVEVWSPSGENQAKDVAFRNNLFVSNGRDNAFNLCKGENITFENNVYWGAHRGISEHDVSARAFDPDLVCPGRTGDGRAVLGAYVPRDPRMAEGAATPAKPAPVDAMGKPTEGRAYVGAFLPEIAKPQ